MSFIEEMRSHIRQLQIPGYGDDEVGFMSETVRLWIPDQLFDWGTNRGSSARIFYEANEKLERDCMVISIELPDSHEAKDHPGVHCGTFVNQLPVLLCRGDGVTTALRFAQPWGRKLFFLDGNHDEENVIRELDLVSHTYPDAAMLMHDTAAGGPCEALKRWDSSMYDVEYLASQAGMTRLLPCL